MITNSELAAILSSAAQLYAFRGDNPFKVKAFRKAAETVLSAKDSIAKRVKGGKDLTVLPGIGSGLAAVISEIVATGTLKSLDELVQKLDPTDIELIQYPGLDLKYVRSLYKRFMLENVADLKALVTSGDLARKAGARAEAKLRSALFGHERMLLYDALPLAETLKEVIGSMKSVSLVEIAGSVRRRRDTVGSIRVLVMTTAFGQLIKKVSALGMIKELREGREDAAIFSLAQGPLLHIQNSTAARWGLDLIHLTGSTAHIRALPRKFQRLTGGKSEEDVYRTLGLSWIPPELREDRGEVTAAKNGTLPILIELADIKGDLHCHTTESDGSASLLKMAGAAKKKGYEYLGISDHSQSLKITNGLSRDRLLAQGREIREYNKSENEFRLFRSSEVDMLEDGSLDYSDSVLKQLDYRICSIHSKFSLSSAVQTKRILNAMNNSYFNVMAHPCGRLLRLVPAIRSISNG